MHFFCLEWVHYGHKAVLNTSQNLRKGLKIPHSFIAQRIDRIGCCSFDRLEADRY